MWQQRFLYGISRLLSRHRVTLTSLCAESFVQFGTAASLSRLSLSVSTSTCLAAAERRRGARSVAASDPISPLKERTPVRKRALFTKSWTQCRVPHLVPIFWGGNTHYTDAHRLPKLPKGRITLTLCVAIANNIELPIRTQNIVSDVALIGCSILLAMAMHIVSQQAESGQLYHVTTPSLGSQPIREGKSWIPTNQINGIQKDR